MLKFLIPRIALSELPVMLALAFIGAIFSAIYGVIHDHVTYTICPEYYTKLKFVQFKYADFGLGDRFFVSAVGFLSSWWVGFVIVWFFARRHIPNQPRKSANRNIFHGCLVVFASGFLAAILSYAYGTWRGPDSDYASWATILRRFSIEDSYGFIRVAYIHNSSYLGGLIGFIIALVVIRPCNENDDCDARIGT